MTVWLRCPGGYSRLLLWLVLLFAIAPLCFPQASVQTPPLPSQEQNILQLRSNLAQALALCVTLETNLQLRLANYNLLKKDYDELNLKLEALQRTLSDSETSLIQAQSDLDSMRKLLATLQDSLSRASKSLADYKSDTDAAVRAVEMQRNAWKIAGITFGVAAAGEACYIVGHLLKAW